jgi:hypothetical protein
VGNNKLTGGVDGVSGKVKGDRVEAVPGREGRVGLIRADGIKGKLDLGKEIRPAVRGKRHVTGS